MFQTISHSINFTSIEEFEQTCKGKALELDVVSPVSVIVETKEKNNFYWCRILLVDSTSVVKKYVFVWDTILDKWEYDWDLFTLVIGE